MEKDTEAGELTLSVDLNHAIDEHLNLLEKVEASRELYEGRLLREAIRRYVNLWLPLIAKYGENEKLLPPVDVQWVWYCHALSPVQYAEDVMKLEGRAIPHLLLSKSERSRSTDRAKSHWGNLFPEEPFEISKDTCTADTETHEEKMELSRRLENYAFKERHFYYQVSLPHFRKEKFIATAIKRYKRFLCLVKNLKQKMDVSSDIELIWRSHILHSKSYTDDCIKWFGFVLNHSFQDLERLPALETIHDEKDESHKKVTAEISNGLLVGHLNRRGESPRLHLSNLSDDEKMCMSAKTCQLAIEQIYVEGYKIENKASKLSTEVYLSGSNDRSSKSLVQFQGCHYDPEQKKPIKFTVDPQRYSSVTFVLTKQSGSRLKGHKAAQGTHTFDLIPLIETSPNAGTTFSETGTFTMKDHMMKISARGMITPTDRGPIQLSHIPCANDECVVVNDPVLKTTLLRTGLSPDELANIGDVLVSTHRFVNRSSRLIFTCKLHQKLPFLGLVHVLFQGEMVVEGHVITPDALPHQDFPGLPCLGESEVAFVIKNSNGDWGIVVAGYGSDFSGAMRRGIHETEMRLYTIAPVSKLWTMATFSVPTQDGSFVISDPGYRIDLKTGLFSLQKNCPDVAEVVALAFGVASLHALLWHSSQEPARRGKGKAGVRFAAARPDSWSDVAKGNRFLNMIKQ